MARSFVFTAGLLALTVCTPAIGGTAWAQPAINMRVGAHEEYSRLVFDWPEPVQYEVRRQDGRALDIIFSAPARLAQSRADWSGVPGITAVTELSTDEQNLSLRLGLVDGADYRHFIIGSRIVVDIYYPEGTAQPQSQASKKEPAHTQPAEPHRAAEPSVPKPAKKAGRAPAMKPAPVAPVETRPASAPAPDAPAMDAHVVNFTLTEEVGTAAFERNGWLWIVFDRPDINVPPRIAGPAPEMFPDFEKMAIKGGVAYRMKLPAKSDFYLYGEGGGLIWRIILTPKPREFTGVAAQRRIASNIDILKQGRAAEIFWPLDFTRRILEVPDPDVGDIINVVTVTQADQFTGPRLDFVDFTALNAPIGLAAVAEIDNLDIERDDNGVTLSRPGGLAVSGRDMLIRHMIQESAGKTDEISDVPDASAVAQDQEFSRLFDFNRWLMGGAPALPENERVILSGIAGKDPAAQVEDLLLLAKMNLANGYGPEALGYLAFSYNLLPEISESPEFIALRGAAYTLSGKYEQAFPDLFNPALERYDELDYWRAYTLAGLEDWRQAQEVMPSRFDALVEYPLPLLENIGLKLAEIALRGGEVETARSVMEALEKERKRLMRETAAGLDYLRGEAYRQRGYFEKAAEIWKALAKGKDDLYRVKAGLALTLLQLENGDIEYKAAIDRLERLRYAWRGDALEAQVNYRLGRLYIEEDEYLKGFTILRDAASMSPDSDVGRDITEYMTYKFTDLLLQDEDMSPLQAVTLYEEFRELTPSDKVGNEVLQKLAERLVDADLLDRAAEVLQHQVDYRLDEAEKAPVSLRLGGIYLLDRNAGPALKALNEARRIYAQQPQKPGHKERLHEIDLLRARALSDLGRVDEALELLRRLPPGNDISRLRADIAWQARRWADAAESLQDLILDAALDPSRPLNEEQADLLLNRAVSLNLAGDRVALAEMRGRYLDAMKRTSRAHLFDIVTRPRQEAVLADRETIEAIVSEVDIFRKFLKTYLAEESAGQGAE